MRDYLGNGQKIRFIFPIDGDCLNDYDLVDSDSDGERQVKVMLEAKESSELEVNGIKAERYGDYYCATIPLYGTRNTFVATDLKTKESSTIVVYDIKDAIKKYRISVDDIILCFADLTQNQENYASLFDQPFLKMFWELHHTYGTKVHFNLFYETDECPDFIRPVKYFNLSMMTDKYKEEWIKNSNWLRLSFHSRREHPDRPYHAATIEQYCKECEMVHKEILRFAGKECLSNVTTVHWGDVSVGGVRGLRTMGYKVAMGYFEVLNDEPYVAYFYPKDITEYVGERDFWKDNVEDVLYGRIDAVLNLQRLDNIEEKLDEVSSKRGRAGFIEMVTHEQYFYDFYKGYLKDYQKITETACEWMKRHGYEPCLFEELLDL